MSVQVFTYDLLCRILTNGRTEVSADHPDF